MRSILFIAASLTILTLELDASLSQSNAEPTGLICETYDCKDGDCTVGTEVCEEGDADKPVGCFVVWSTNNVTSEVKVTMKGCFLNPSDCNNTECVDTSHGTKNNLNYCCCRANMCNREHKWVPVVTKPPDVIHHVTPETNIVLTAAIIVNIMVLVFGVGFTFFWRHRKQSMFNEIPTIEPEITSSSPNLALRPIQLIEVKAHGRFGVVWKAQLMSQEVAVKIFQAQERQSWITEQEIFKLPRMNHPNILQFIGCEKRTEASSTDFWLITAYCQHGSLCDYLKSHTVTWQELRTIAESMSRGLMHLHEEIQSSKSEGLKPSIAHRDFKSKNVLLKDDLTACIADFGLALVFTPGKPCGDTHGQVGTRRYMAPEILEGAINFTRDAFLRIDVYACGLVLWELVSRCTAHGGAVDEYKLPFEAELGLHATLEEMQENVVTKKLRPRIHDHWRNHNGLNALCDTMEECWDHDAEARLSSSCVMERVSQHGRFQSTTPLLIETNTTNDLPPKVASESV
ncbi:activin receptor type-2A [Topomyia yanbarensis]|uniref:activin receptor type-2A n=1 Tax=Topomyia yanbarensis TaxID=2498891 RepID=UPI00273AFC1C|nr:activin receptor type-2A [Topomyia yanbarensis]